MMQEPCPPGATVARAEAVRHSAVDDTAGMGPEDATKLAHGVRKPAGASTRRGPTAARPGSTGQARVAAAGARRDNDGADDSGDDDSGSLEGELQQEPDPLYDERADDEDAAWADRQRGGRVSDAVLSCPGCFTTLCIDCQRHEKHHQQYRAMFVMNCQVDEDKDEAGGGGAFDPASTGPQAGGGKGRGGRRPKRAKTSAQYRRVRCGVCGTEVGALEVEEELYHFYHVFPSNA